MADQLYGDLVESTSERAELEKELAEERAKNARLEEDLAEARQALEQTKEELAVVKRNISAIYHTAKKEIQRKDALIAELRKVQPT